MFLLSHVETNRGLQKIAKVLVQLLYTQPSLQLKKCIDSIFFLPEGFKFPCFGE